jgi:hypothetical protein
MLSCQQSHFLLAGFGGHASILSTQEDDTGRFWVQDQPELHSETMSQKQTRKEVLCLLTYSTAIRNHFTAMNNKSLFPAPSYLQVPGTYDIWPMSLYCKLSHLPRDYLSWKSRYYLSTRIWTQDFKLAKQVLWHLSHTPNTLCCLFSFQIGPHTFPWGQPPTSSYLCHLGAGTTGEYHHRNLFFWWGLPNFLPEMASNFDPPISASQGAGITAVHYLVGPSVPF